MSSSNDPISIEQFRERHELPVGTALALTPGGRRDCAVWIPDDIAIPHGWVSTGNLTSQYRKIRPHEYRSAGQAAFDDLNRMEAPAPEVINATSTPDMETAYMVLAAAERMGPIEVTRHDGTTVVFTPAPTKGPRR
ncbi:hypothetical protein Q8791_23045 [Nocardiopsis sp. CT-R113]|uniref:Uncharacterized protein n=1 Tax=Nocardiopsis codii TaxID=3065942 RepID=A0ABU7KCY3_9ACTN|nr:hypothetical protein [Nocardiopsis sp. CT-R113]MEE2040098.1 hypothetical protein [Nocardiopsis sp. CT-R113]